MRQEIEYLDKDKLNGKFVITTATPMSGRSSARYHVFHNGWLAFFSDSLPTCERFVREECQRNKYDMVGSGGTEQLTRG